MFTEYENLDGLKLINTDGQVLYYPRFLSNEQCHLYLQQIKEEQLFEQNEITLFGKKVKVPRLEVYFALNGEKYAYAGQALTVHSFPSYLNELRQAVELFTGCKYNALLVNYYRNGQDSNGWHADNEKALGKNPSIASISLGATRPFEFRHEQSGKKTRVNLEQGSLLHMCGAIQHHYKHQLPKVKGLEAERINLTFRWIHPH